MPHTLSTLRAAIARIERGGAAAAQHGAVPVGLAAHIVADIYMWGPLMAGATMAAVPVVVLYIVAQRFLVQGLFAGSVRG